MLDLSLFGMAAVFFVLSWGLARLINTLPLPCQLKWSVWTVVGFSGLCLGEILLRWDIPTQPQYIMADMLILFTASVPAMMWLNIRQIELFGYDEINERFYYFRFAGIIATWRNFIRSKQPTLVFRAFFVSSFWPIYHLLARVFWLDFFRKIQDD
jgi:hypothetical protein